MVFGLGWPELIVMLVAYGVRMVIPVLVIVALALLIRRLLREERAQKTPEAVQERASLGEVIRRHREACGMTQELVAQKLGLSRQAVSKWESGKAEPSATSLLSLCDLFGVDVADLLREVNR